MRVQKSPTRRDSDKSVLGVRFKKRAYKDNVFWNCNKKGHISRYCRGQNKRSDKSQTSHVGNSQRSSYHTEER